MIEVYRANTLRERWDDTARIYTRWDAAGTQVEQRPYTAQENAQADARAAAELLSTNETTLQTRAAAALAANATDLTQAQTVWDGANTIANGTGTLTTAQLTTAVRSLATGVRILAAHDRAQIKQINALIRLVTQALDSVADTA